MTDRNMYLVVLTLRRDPARLSPVAVFDDALTAERFIAEKEAVHAHPLQFFDATYKVVPVTYLGT